MKIKTKKAEYDLGIHLQNYHWIDIMYVSIFFPSYYSWLGYIYKVSTYLRTIFNIRNYHRSDIQECIFQHTKLYLRKNLRFFSCSALKSEKGSPVILSKNFQVFGCLLCRVFSIYEIIFTKKFPILFLLCVEKWKALYPVNIKQKFPRPKSLAY